MPDIIQLLPDHIANQIAAGEVIQRPASAVKELLENAIDADATEIKLIIADAGKSLVQVMDNGKGMSENDARMAFARHATSKIKNIDDLFRISTMGFRGEALASIAAVALVELKTKRAEDETGLLLEIENSEVIRQEPVAIADGTQIAMKNLFFNLPARRNFLRTNASEMRHIIDEFMRIALAFPAIHFTLFSNGQEVFHLEKGTLKQRILQLLGNQYNSKLVSVLEKTDYMDIYGFVGKPDTAKKTRGDQYFFVNNRFIRSPYLNHALMNAYQDLIPADSFPLYVLFIELNPAQVDINVHPTKQEIKFEDERIVYAFVQAAVRHSLAQFSITPTLDFDLDPGIQGLDAVSKPVTAEKEAAIVSSSLYKTFSQKNQAHLLEPDNKSELRHWRDFFEGPKDQSGLADDSHPGVDAAQVERSGESGPEETLFNNRPYLFENGIPLQIHNSYIIAQTQEGFILVQQQAAHERILYEQFAAASEGKKVSIQRSLFPTVIQLSTQDAILLNELLDDLHELGYLIESFGKDAFVVQGTPADLQFGNEHHTVENLLEQYKHFSSDRILSRREKLIRSLARQHAVKTGTPLTSQEMGNLLVALFTCRQATIAPNGNPAFFAFGRDYLDKLFGR